MGNLDDRDTLKKCDEPLWTRDTDEKVRHDGGPVTRDVALFRSVTVHEGYLSR